MEREISDDIEIANSFMLFQSIRKSPAVDKTASVFDKLNLNVKKKKLIEHGIYDANIA